MRDIRVAQRILPKLVLILHHYVSKQVLTRQYGVIQWEAKNQWYVGTIF
jgi:hypothetical protein